MWEQERHLMHRERELLRPIYLAPHLRVRWRVNRLRHKLVPGVRKHPTFSRHRAEQRVEHEKSARYRPSVANTRGNAAPVVTRKTSAGSRDQLRDLGNRFRVNARLLRGKFERVFGVELF